MKKLVSLLTITAIAGALAAVPAMAQGTSKQQPTKQQPTKTVTKTAVHKTVSDTVNKGQTGMKHESMAADTSKKGKMAARHTRRHHKAVSKTAAKKKVPKADEK